MEGVIDNSFFWLLQQQKEATLRKHWCGEQAQLDSAEDLAGRGGSSSASQPVVPAGNQASSDVSTINGDLGQRTEDAGGPATVLPSAAAAAALPAPPRRASDAAHHRGFTDTLDVPCPCRQINFQAP